MEQVKEELEIVKRKIGEREEEIKKAKEDGRSEAYLTALENRATELQKKENILLSSGKHIISSYLLIYYYYFYFLSISSALPPNQPGDFFLNLV